MAYKYVESEGRECLECGQEILYGRSDKKFCSEECKNRYHNRKGNEFVRVHSKTMRILDNNYRILSRCLEQGQTSVDLGDAILWGFNPDYLTGIFRNKIKTELRCYDIKYYRSESRLYHIERVPQDQSPKH